MNANMVASSSQLLTANCTIVKIMASSFRNDLPYSQPMCSVPTCITARVAWVGLAWHRLVRMLIGSFRLTAHSTPAFFMASSRMVNSPGRAS